MFACTFFSDISTFCRYEVNSGNCDTIGIGFILWNDLTPKYLQQVSKLLFVTFLGTVYPLLLTLCKLCICVLSPIFVNECGSLFKFKLTPIAFFFLLSITLELSLLLF